MLNRDFSSPLPAQPYTNSHLAMPIKERNRKQTMAMN